MGKRTREGKKDRKERLESRTKYVKEKEKSVSKKDEKIELNRTRNE